MYCTCLPESMFSIPCLICNLAFFIIIIIIGLEDIFGIAFCPDCYAANGAEANRGGVLTLPRGPQVGANC